MSKLIKFIKNITYINLSNSRQLVATMAVFGSLSSFIVTAGAPITLADEGAFDGSDAFLTVQPVIIDEKDNGEMALQNDFFFMSNNNRALAVPANDSAPVANPSNRVVIVTAYSSTPDQTDDSPFITANGTYVRDGIIAANFLPFGAKVKFPEYSGDKIFTVADRMAKKHNTKMDIWMESRGAALNFGVQKLAYEIVE